MTETATAAEILYIRFVRTGLTFAGSVWRKGSVTTVSPEQEEYRIFQRSKEEQEARWPDGAFFEHITAEQYAAEKGGTTAGAPEPALPPKTSQLPPPPEDGGIRGKEHGTPAPGPTGHVPPAELTAPLATAADPDLARWPWYADADVLGVLTKVAEMGDAEATAFLAYETSHKARPGVLGPMTGS